MTEKGVRVGAILRADPEVVEFFGYGVYKGDEIPPEGTPGVFGIDAHELGITNPKIELDSGKVVWGCMCWFAPEDQTKKMIGDRKIVPVDVDEYLKENKPRKREDLE